MKKGQRVQKSEKDAIFNGILKVLREKRAGNAELAEAVSVTPNVLRYYIMKLVEMECIVIDHLPARGKAPLNIYEITEKGRSRPDAIAPPAVEPVKVSGDCQWWQFSNGLAVAET